MASKCQLHKCGAVCTKYSFKNKGEATGPPCRFRAPWALHEKTQFTDDGKFEIHRNHPWTNRYSPALAVGLRHNHDTTFLLTSSAGLSMVYYGTNYGTKLHTPVSKRVALMKAVLESVRVQEDSGPADLGHGPEVHHKRRVQNTTRQFLGRAANKIFTDRELSAVEVCAHLLGKPNHFSSEKKWCPVHLDTLYWTLFSAWPGLREKAGLEIQGLAAPLTVSFGGSGRKLSHFEAYPFRGEALKDTCFYDYMCIVEFSKIGSPKPLKLGDYVLFDRECPFRTKWVQRTLTKTDQAVPVYSGLLTDDFEKETTGFFERFVKYGITYFIVLDC